jgi:hypothetical protein
MFMMVPRVGSKALSRVSRLMAPPTSEVMRFPSSLLRLELALSATSVTSSWDSR